MQRTIKIAQFGLGPIGCATARAAAARPWAELVGGVDRDPAKRGRDLGELAGTRAWRGRQVYASLDELLERARPQVVLHTASSRFKEAFPDLQALAARGIHVVSSCEELVFPQLRQPGLAERLDRLCRRTGARVIGTGVNPGFVMDLLPLCLTGVSCAVHEIHVERVVDASTRREPLQRKIGSGLPPTEFRRRLRAGQAGHAGLKESLALLAHGLGWPRPVITETGDAVIARHRLRTQYLTVEKGQTCGLHQRAEGKINGRVRLTLDLRMCLGAEDPHDAIRIEGDPPLRLRIEGGVAGDQATVGALLNAVPRLLAALAGLRLLTDLALPRLQQSSGFRGA